MLILVIALVYGIVSYLKQHHSDDNKVHDLTTIKSAMDNKQSRNPQSIYDVTGGANKTPGNNLGKLIFSLIILKLQMRSVSHPKMAMPRFQIVGASL